ncbi:MAG: hypothetical protein VYD03_02315, partial [Pseudomonadota bacterium]|nr:hypothetical protein [Pseudomonadota bacterium]
QFKSMVSPELHYQVDTVLSRDTAAANVLKEVIVIATEEQGFFEQTERDSTIHPRSDRHNSV